MTTGPCAWFSRACLTEPRPGQAGVAGAPADDHQVGAGGQADQGPARVAVHDLLTDVHAGVLGPPVVEQAGQMPGRVGRGLGAGFGGRRAGPGDFGLRRVPGVQREQAGLAQARLLEGEGERVTAAVQVSDADADQSERARGLVPDDRDGAGCVARDVPADRAEQQGGERAPAPGAQHQHQRARAGVSDGLVYRTGQLVGIDQHAVRRLDGPLGGRGQRLVTLAEQDVGHPLLLARGRARDHPGRRLRRGHDPQRGTAEHGLPGGPVDRPQ